MTTTWISKSIIFLVIRRLQFSKLKPHSCMKNLTRVTGMQRLNPTSTAFNGKNSIDFSVPWIRALAVGFDPFYLLVTLKDSLFFVLIFSGKIQEFEGRWESLAQEWGHGHFMDLKHIVA